MCIECSSYGQRSDSAETKGMVFIKMGTCIEGSGNGEQCDSTKIGRHEPPELCPNVMVLAGRKRSDTPEC